MLKLRLKAKITDGTVKLPRFNTGHLSERNPYTTDKALQGTQELFGLQYTQPTNHPLIKHLSGDFIGTFEIHLPEWREFKRLKEFRKTIERNPGENLLDFEERRDALVVSEFLNASN